MGTVIILQYLDFHFTNQYVLGLSNILAYTILFFSLLVKPSYQVTRYTDDPNSCQLIGDPDVYGIGLRLSYYLAYASGLIALAAGHHAAIQDAKKGLNIITFVIFIILLNNTVNNSFALLEWLIVSSLVMFIPVSVFVSAIIIDIGKVDDLIGSGIILFHWSLFCVLQPWLLFTLREQGRRSQCEAKQFFFAYLDLYNPRFVLLSKFCAIICCIMGVVLIPGSIFLVGKGMAKSISLRTKDTSESQTPADTTGSAETSSDERNEAGMSTLEKYANYLKAGMALTGVYTIVYTEKMISGNNIDLSDVPLSSTGQLVPFIVGLCTFVSTIWAILKDRAERRRLKAIVQVHKDVEKGKTGGKAAGNEDAGKSKVDGQGFTVAEDESHERKSA
jgi:hypothetical protein